jgi:hypothetical protein
VDGRLLFREAPWAQWAVGIAGGVLTVALLATGSLDAGDLALRGGLPLAVTLVLWVVVRSLGRAELWATDDALVVRRYGRRRLRIPWAEITSGTWATVWAGDGPAVSTRDDPGFYILLGSPLLLRGWPEGAPPMRDEFVRRGLDWQYDVSPQRLAPLRPLTRWDR